MASTEPQSYMSVITIDPDYDFTIVAIEKTIVKNNTQRDDSDDGHASDAEHELVRFKAFNVRSAKITAIKPASEAEGACTTWKALFPAETAGEKSSVSFEVEVTSLAAMEILLRVCHETLILASYMVDIDEFRHLAELCDLLSAHKSLLYEYFADWYLRHKREIKSVKDYLELLFPAWYFVEPEAFLTATRSLVYSCSGYISERKPTVLKRWHLPQRILQQLNAARGSLRKNLVKEIWKLPAMLERSDCPCAGATFLGYYKSLTKRKVYLIDNSIYQTSINEILRRLEGYSWEAPAESCVECANLDFIAQIRKASAKIRNHFDGLCYDCMYTRKTEDYDEDYFRHHDVDWDSGCRVRHEQPTWFFSFNARDKEKQGIADRITDAASKNN